ncbi:MAG: hypothetical protein VXY93_14340, partial [Pseudomonadota bacterium]|nr:hypothetical protein [Pseudomonadota bacterium]
TTTGLAVTGVSTFTGAIDANGDLDVDGHTNLDNVSVAGVTTFVGNVNIANDTGKIQIGASQDLQFYHDYSGGSENSHIYQTTSKHLLISAYTQFARVNGTWGVLNLGNSHNMLRATAGSDVKLYFNNGEKLATTNTGINVTGNVVSDGLVVDGNTDLNGDLDVDGHTNLDNVSIAGVTTVTNNYFDFKPTGGGNAHLRMLSTGTGDAGIFFDAANGDISGSDYCFIGQKNNLDFVIDANANAGNIDFQRAGTTQVRIDSSGRIGVG